jgi:hypothetical protein
MLEKPSAENLFKIVYNVIEHIAVMTPYKYKTFVVILGKDLDVSNLSLLIPLYNKYTCSNTIIIAILLKVL